MKLVEVIRTPKTSDATFDTLLDLTKRMGKTSIKAKDVPG
jgi:3-hydroxyacyl-CoA dehydrogenase